MSDTTYMSDPALDAVNDYLDDVPGAIADIWKHVTDQTVTVTPMNTAELVSTLEDVEAAAGTLRDLITAELARKAGMN